MGYAGFPQPQPKLPAAFEGVHPLILQQAERIAARSLVQGSDVTKSAQGSQTTLPPPSNMSPNLSQDSWLPDIYHFASVGLSVEERYTFASAQPTPFTPSSPRVDEKEEFNFDHGALSADMVEETSYMAWF